MVHLSEARPLRETERVAVNIVRRGDDVSQGHSSYSASSAMTRGLFAQKAFQTERHQSSIALSRSGPGVARITSAAVIESLSSSGFAMVPPLASSTRTNEFGGATLAEITMAPKIIFDRRSIILGMESRRAPKT
ncbi:MAG TPA: hypothetical protein VKE51_34390 [Vicinamibacterales bacterium]|nr:hypothetical protein [Vicinamibacterales bacterium]